MLSGIKCCVNSLPLSKNLFLANVTDFLAQQTRSTYVLKRRYPVPLYKRGGVPKKFKARHFIYDFVENTARRKQAPMELLLTSYVEGIGDPGDKIWMKPNKAYRDLLLPGLAVYTSPWNLEKYKDLTTETNKTKFSSPYVERTMNVLSLLNLAVVMNRVNPWTIEKWHVRVSFRRARFVVPEETITMPERKISGPNMDLENKEFYVIVTINNREQVKVRCRVCHWVDDPKKTPFAPDSWRYPGEAIFPEDQPILDAMPRHKFMLEPEAEED